MFWAVGVSQIATTVLAFRPFQNKQIRSPNYGKVCALPTQRGCQRLCAWLVLTAPVFVLDGKRL